MEYLLRVNGGRYWKMPGYGVGSRDEAHRFDSVQATYWMEYHRPKLIAETEDGVEIKYDDFALFNEIVEAMEVAAIGKQVEHEILHPNG